MDIYAVSQRNPKNKPSTWFLYCEGRRQEID